MSATAVTKPPSGSHWLYEIKWDGYRAIAEAFGTGYPLVASDELGVEGFDVASVMGLYAPAGTPPQVVARLQAEIAKLMREPAMATMRPSMLPNSSNAPASMTTKPPAR